MRVLVITNKRSTGRGVSSAFVSNLLGADAEVTLREFRAETSMVSLLRDADAYDRVVAGGGDGTAASVAYALRDTQIPLTVFPGGTANLLSMNLRLPNDPASLAAATLSDRTLRADLVEVTYEDPSGAERRFGSAVMAGAGFDAAMVASAEGLKPMLGPAAYLLSAAGNILPSESRFELELDGDTVETRGIGVVLVNFAKIQFDLAVAHNSDPRDGAMEVVVLRAKSSLGLIPTVWAAILDRISDFPDRPGLEVYRARRVKVKADPPLPMQYDGESVDGKTPFSAIVLPGAALFTVAEGFPVEQTCSTRPERRDATHPKP